MIAVIFEVRPKPDKKQNYLDIAAALPAHPGTHRRIAIRDSNRARQGPFPIVLPE